MREDTHWIIKVKQGDREAFNKLYKEHYFPVRSYAMLLLSANEADDVVQDVFFNVWVHRERLNPELSFRSYLLRSVYNTSLNIIKHNKYTTDYASSYKKEIEDLGYQHYDPDKNEVIHRLYNQDLYIQIHTAIESLSPKCQEVFRLSYLEEMPSKEISVRLGISVSTVENHIHSALKQLRKKLESCKGLFLLLFSNFL